MFAQNSKWVSIGKMASFTRRFCGGFTRLRLGACHLPADPHLLSKLPLFDSPLRRDFEQTRFLNALRNLVNAVGAQISLRSKQLSRKAQLGNMDLDQYYSRDLRQRLSPKAKPWDNGNTGQEKRQSSLSAYLKRVVVSIPSRDFVLSCKSCKSCLNRFFLLLFAPCSTLPD